MTRGLGPPKRAEVIELGALTDEPLGADRELTTARDSFWIACRFLLREIELAALCTGDVELG
eukprot:316368-Amphidinium_carterae.1